MAEFNLIDKPWIPCIDLIGNLIEYGIRDTLLKAHELREICDESPLVTVAIHRMLLAILYRAFQGPTDTQQWKQLYQTQSFTSHNCLQDYFTKLYDRFYLFDTARPFMQVASLDLNEYNDDGEIKEDKSDGLMRLAREAPDLGGRILFDHRVGTKRLQYEPKQIARMLLSAQSFSGTGNASDGKIGNKTIVPAYCQFAPCVEGLVLWIQGESLFDTLFLNLVPRDYIDNDKPAWEDDLIVDTAIQSWKKPLRFTGPIQRYGPLSRFIRIIDRQSMFFTNGLKTTADSEDPMKVYLRSDDKKDYLAVKLREDKSAWRDVHTLLSGTSPLCKAPACLNHFARLVQEGTLMKKMQPKANIVGLATAQGKVLLWRYERLPMPAGIIGSIDFAERLGLAQRRTGLIPEAENIGHLLSRGLFWSGTSKKTVRTEPVGRVQAISDLVLTPSLQLRSTGVLRTPEGRLPEDAHNKAALDLSKSLDPSPAYWARLEEHFFALLENLPTDWDYTNDEWKPDDQQIATRQWREQIKLEAQMALEESIRSLGTTARVIQAIARVRTDFNDYDLKPPLQKMIKKKENAKGGKKK